MKRPFKHEDALRFEPSFEEMERTFEDADRFPYAPGRSAGYLRVLALAAVLWAKDREEKRKANT